MGISTVATRTIRIGVTVLRGIPRLHRFCFELLSSYCRILKIGLQKSKMILRNYLYKKYYPPQPCYNQFLIEKPYFIQYREFGPLRERRQVFGNIPCCPVASQVAYHESQENEYLRCSFKVSARTKFQRVQLQAGNPTTPKA